MAQSLVWITVFTFCMGVWFLFRSDPRNSFPRFLSDNFRTVSIIAIAVCAIWMLDYSVRYAIFPIRLNHTPSGVTLLSQAVAAMKPIFFSSPQGDMQLMVYGPFSFRVGAAFIPFFDNPFTADGAASLLMFWGFVALMSILFLRRFGTNAGIAAILCLFVLILFQIPLRFELKEASLLFGISLSLFAAFSIRNSAVSMLLAGLGLAMCAIGKPHGAIGVMALIPLVIYERGTLWIAGAAGFSIVFALVSFLHPSFSLEAYFAVIDAFSGTRVKSWNHLPWSLIGGTVVLAVLIGAIRGRREKPVFISAILMTFAFVFILLGPATDWGSGNDHIFYMMPPLMVLAGQRAVLAGIGKRAAFICGGWIFASALSLCFSFHDTPSYLRTSLHQRDQFIGERTYWNSFEKNMKKTSQLLNGLVVEVMPSDSSLYTLYIAGQSFIYPNGRALSHFPHFMMEPVKDWNETYMSVQIAALESQKVDVFLLAHKEGEMFSMESVFPSSHRIFRDDFESFFLKNYAPVGHIYSYPIYAAKSRLTEIVEILSSRSKQNP
ncbi:MAG: hypothetical protein ACR2NQ_04040 [Thermodesulfobacteriota bacterium]